MPSDVDELIALFEEAGGSTVFLDSTQSNKVDVATLPPIPAPPSLGEGHFIECPEKNTITEKINNSIETIQITKPEKREETPIKREGGAVLGASTASWLAPNQHDTLFWCLYCIHFGYNDYQQVSRNYGIRLLEVKKNIATWIQGNTGRLKQTNYKITKASIQEILSDCLTSQKETNMISLLAFLSYFNMNVLIIDPSEKLLMEFIGVVDVDNPTYLIQKDGYGKYKVKDEVLTIDAINSLKEKCVLLDSYEKPLKSISNYKVDDLEKLAKKLHVFEEGKKYKKADLYMTVFEACSFPINTKPMKNYRQ